MTVRLGLAADDRLQKQGGRKWNKERKRERENPPLPCSLSSSSGRLLDWRKQRGGRVAVTAYCLSSVCCGSSLSAHSFRPGYLYPLNIHAGEGRLQPFSSSHTLWRRCIKETACCEGVLLVLLFFQDFLVYIWPMLGDVLTRGVCAVLI